MDFNPLKHLSCEGFDVLAVYDYTDLSFAEDISTYGEITLIAWSMGVLAASMVASDFKISRAIAINGTQRPVDARFGIHPKIFQLTLDNLDENTRDKFFENMFQSAEEVAKFQKPERKIENQREELAFLQKLSLENVEFDFGFDTVLISNQDKIIPTKNQKNFWQTKKVKVVELSCGHYPFFKWNSFKEILDETL